MQQPQTIREQVRFLLEEEPDPPVPCLRIAARAVGEVRLLESSASPGKGPHSPSTAGTGVLRAEKEEGAQREKRFNQDERQPCLGGTGGACRFCCCRVRQVLAALLLSLGLLTESKKRENSPRSYRALRSRWHETQTIPLEHRRHQRFWFA